MGDAIIGSTIQVLLEKVIFAASDRIHLMIGFKNELEELRGYAKDIQAVLADAESKQSRNPILQRWLHKVQLVAFEADNVLDELLYESLRREVKSRAKTGLSRWNGGSISFRWRMGSKVRDINQKLKAFNLEATGSIGLIRLEDTLLPAASGSEVAKCRQTDSLPLQFVVGRRKESSDIVNMLLGSSDPNVSVLPIVGMGGLGKSTLAKSIYNDSQIDRHFSKKCWICVSDNFEVAKVFGGILESLKGTKVEVSGRDTILQQVKEEIIGKRFLFVLDDVWNEDPELWNDFLSSLVALNSVSGSCCLLTTRLHTTANLVSTLVPYVLEKLSDEECWSILGRRAAKGGEMPEELKVHRNQILRRCQGLPLAANAIGGLLSLQRREDWLSVVETKVLKVSVDVEGKIMPILRLSYENLPSPSIKKCFAYCSIFVKDTKLSGERLIQSWMAEGFLQENAGSMEETGGNDLKILSQSSLLEEVNDKFDGRYYQMHDLVHELAEFVSKQEGNQEANKYMVRHLAVYKEESKDMLNATSSWVQTLKGNISNELLLRFKYLHMLSLSGVDIMNLASSISKLQHLRYLALSDSNIRILPESLCKLYNLQTLGLYRCHGLKGLPQGLSNLISLRHLDFYHQDLKFKMPAEMGLMTCLQTLKFFNVGKEKGCEINELISMKNLKGKLTIRNLELVKGKKGCRLASLFEKENLVHLKLCWGSKVHRDSGSCDELVLEGLEPHPTLQKLEITNFTGVYLPQWLKKLSALVKLSFIDCKGFTELPALGHLPYLEDLLLSGLEDVVCIGDMFYNVDDSKEGKVFPSLKSLKLRHMMNLSEWKELETVNDDISVFPKLERLDIVDCCHLSTTPTYFPSLNMLLIIGNVQVSVARDIICKSAGLLKDLTLRSMSGLRSLSEVIRTELTSLEEFAIYDCKGLIDIPSQTLECCTSLQGIAVYTCPNLVSCPLDLQHIPSLSSIWFKDCPNLFTKNASMPRGFSHLVNLGVLSIGPFSNDAIELFDWSGLVLGCSSTLHSLMLSGSPQVHSLPEQLQHLTSLGSLHLKGFESLESLPNWFGNLTSLNTLELWNFSKLQFLPFAHVMGRLINLRVLSVKNCPLLKESLTKDYHSAWSKLPCRPTFYVGVP